MFEERWLAGDDLRLVRLGQYELPAVLLRAVALIVDDELRLLAEQTLPVSAAKMLPRLLERF